MREGIILRLADIFSQRIKQQYQWGAGDCELLDAELRKIHGRGAESLSWVFVKFKSASAVDNSGSQQEVCSRLVKAAKNHAAFHTLATVKLSEDIDFKKAFVELLSSKITLVFFHSVEKIVIRFLLSAPVNLVFFQSLSFAGWCFFFI
jgi:hypothetical protein